MRDLLPNGYSLVSHNGGATYDATSGIWSVGALANGASRGLQITARVNATGPYTNSASVNGAQADPDPSNNNDAVTPVPVAQADLSIVKTVDIVGPELEPDLDSTVVFTLVARNDGPSPATGVVVADLLPAGYAFITSSDPANYNPVTGDWQIGDLELGDTRNLQITAGFVAGGPYLNTATISGNEDDPVVGNNQSSVAPGPDPRSNLSVVKVVNNTTPNVGDPVIFTITARNGGLSNDDNVVVEDILPTGYSYLDQTATQGSYDPATGDWTIGSMDAGQQQVLEIEVTVNPTGDYTNIARIEGVNPDPDFSNNTSSVTTAPTAVIDLSIDKSANTMAPPVGSLIVFTMEVANSGPSAATGVQVQDQLPSGYAYVSHSGPGQYDPASGNWYLGDLASGMTMSLSITATVQLSGEYENIATVTGLETDPRPANNQSRVTPVPVLGTLNVAKTADVTTLSQPGVVNYTVQLTNTGLTAVPRADLVVSDELNLAGRTVALDLTYRSGDSGVDDILSPGEVWIYDARYAVTQADLDAGGTLDNIARASAPQITGTPTSPPATVMLAGTPGLRVEKTATPAVNPLLGQAIAYQVRVENTGTLTLTTTVPIDTLTTLTGEARTLTTALSFNAAQSGADASPTTLPVGQVQVWDGSYVVTQSDIDAGGLRNSVIASATAPDATPLDATDSVDTPIRAEPDLLLTKVSSYAGSLVAGTVIDYRVSVENRGNVTLTTATPTDQLTTLAGDARSLTNALAFDPAESTPQTSASQLAVGGTQVWRGSYTLTQADVDAGGLRNIASISATPPDNGPALTAQDDDEIQIDSQPDLQLVKTAQLPTSLVVGESVTYEVAVENTGNVTLTTAVPVDLLSAWDGGSRVLSAPLTFDAAQSTGGATAIALPVGARQIWIGSYVLTQADIDAGGLRNSASITAYPPSGSRLDASDDAEVPIIAAPALTVVKTATLPAQLIVGETIGYTIRITNDGNVTLATPAPVDTLSRLNGDPLVLTSGPSFDAGQSSAGSSETVLAVGGVQVWVGSYQLTQADVDAGGLRNAVSAQGTAPQGGPPAIDEDDVTTLIAADPAMRLVKTAELTASLAAGDTITYVVAVENTGNVTLAAGQPTDTLITLAGDSRTLTTPLVFDASRSSVGTSDSSIPVNGIQVWTGSYVLIQEDIEAGGLRNLADSIGTPPNGGTPIAANDAVDVPVAASPAIEVEKLADLPPATEVGATIAYRVIVRNSGNLILSATTPLDELTTLTGDPRSLTSGLSFDVARSSGGASDTLLPVGAAQVWTGSYVLTQADIDAGGLRNLATATAIPQRGGASLTEDATVDVPINVNPALEVGKTADQSEITQAGPLGYTITVRNSGNVSFALADLEVSDTLQTARGPVDLPLAGPQPDGDADGNGRLDPGEELTYRASYAVSLADLESAFTLVNTARAQVPTGPVTLTPVESPSVAVRVTPDPASLLVEKLAGVQTAMVGDLVPYSIRLSNSGGMRVSARIRDSLPAGFSYREGSARLDGEAVTLEVAGRNLTLAPVSVGAGQERLLTMNVVIGSSVKPGNHVNRVAVSDTISGAALAPDATATVKVIADPVLQCSTVLGRVFDDRDQNGDMNDNGSERGLPNVRLVAPNGVTILTDEFGRFNVPCAALPRAVGSNYMLKLDERTLPAGYRLTTENPRVVRMTAGMLTRLDFGATLAPLIRVDIGAKAFVRDQNGSDRLRPELDQGLRKLVTEVHRTLGMLRITYVLRSGEPEATARARLTMVEQRLRALWRDQGQYKLNIETLIERKGAQE